jgi:hypothetical protein
LVEDPFGDAEDDTPEKQAEGNHEDIVYREDDSDPALSPVPEVV